MFSHYNGVGTKGSSRPEAMELYIGYHRYTYDNKAKNRYERKKLILNSIEFMFYRGVRYIEDRFFLSITLGAGFIIPFKEGYCSDGRDNCNFEWPYRLKRKEFYTPRLDLEILTGIIL